MKKMLKIAIPIFLLLICVFAYIFLRINLFFYKSIKINKNDIITSTSNFLVVSSNEVIKFYDENFKVDKQLEFNDVKNICSDDNTLILLKKDGTVWEYDVNKNDSPVRISNINNVELISFGGTYLVYSDKTNTYLMQIRNHTHPNYENDNLTLYKSYKINNLNNMKVVCNSYALALIDDNNKLYITNRKIIDDDGNLNYKQYLSDDKIDFCDLSSNFSFIVDKEGTYYLTPFLDMSEKMYKTKVGKIKKFASSRNRYILNNKGELFEWGIHRSVISGKEHINDLPERVCRFETFDDIYPTKHCLFARKDNKIYKIKR